MKGVSWQIPPKETPSHESLMRIEIVSDENFQWMWCTINFDNIIGSYFIIGNILCVVGALFDDFRGHPAKEEILKCNQMVNRMKAGWKLGNSEWERNINQKGVPTKVKRLLVVLVKQLATPKSASKYFQKFLWTENINSFRLQLI